MLDATWCARRRERLVQALKPQQTLWFDQPDSLRYLAGFHVDPFSLGSGYGGVLALHPDGSTELWHDDRLPDSAPNCHVDKRHEVRWYDGRTPPLGIRALAVVHALPKAFTGLFSDHPGQPGAEKVIAELASLRRAKDPDEIALIHRCCQAGEAGHAWGRHNIRAGITETQVYAGVQHACTLAAGEAVIVYGDFAVSPGPSKGGGPPTDRVLKTGDLFILDFSVVLGGYRSDFTATWCVGKANPEQLRLYDAACQAMVAAEAKLVPGNAAQDVHHAAKQVFIEHGLADAFPHHAGHGLGLGHPEGPFFVPNSREILLPGDVVTLEPGAYVEGVGGLRIERNYLVGADRFPPSQLPKTAPMAPTGLLTLTHHALGFETGG
jgi:Xaa-Pro aminopeptidase